MGWLASCFGESVLRDGKVVVPNKNYFPDPVSGTIADLTPLFDRVSVYMRIDPETIDLRFFSEGGQTDLGNGMVITTEGPSAAGLYRDKMGRHIISIKIDEGVGATSYIATIAHELCHVHLIGGDHVHSIDDDHEPLTDLATVFFGLGIFNANNVVSDTQWSADGWSGWSVGSHGYLPEEVFGYAFSVYAWVRQEVKPDWAKYLRPNVRSVFIKGLKYLLHEGAFEYCAELSKASPVRAYPGHRINE